MSLVTSGNILNAMLGFVSLVLVGRFLGPEQLGVFSVVFGFFTLLSKLSDLGINATLMRYISDARAKSDVHREHDVLGFGLGLTYVLSALTISIGLPLHQHIANWLNISDYGVYILWAVALAGGWGLFNTYSVFLQAFEQFKVYLYAYTASGIVKVIAVVGAFAISAFTLETAVAVYLLAPFVGYFVARYFFDRFIVHPVHANLNFKILWSMYPFIIYMAIASIIGAVSEQLGIFLSSVLFNSYQTGLFAAAMRLGMVFSLVAGSIGIVLIPRALHYTEVRHLKTFARKTLLLGSAIFALFLPILFMPDLFIKLTMGDEFLPASELLVLLAITGGVQVLSGSFSAVFFALNNAGIFAVTAVITLVVEVTLMTLLAPTFGINAIAIAKLVSSLFNFLIGLFVYSRTIRQLEKSSTSSM